MIPENIQEKDFRYRPVSPQYLYDSYNKYIEHFELYKESMAKANEPYKSQIVTNVHILYQIIERIDERSDYYMYFHSSERHPMRMSQTKEIALFCYWLVKYKPLSFESMDDESHFFAENGCSINETYAAYALMSFIVGLNQDNERFFYDDSLVTLVYSLANRDISKEAFILYVESFIEKKNPA